MDFPEIRFVHTFDEENRYVYKKGHSPLRTSKSGKRESNMKLKK